METVTTTTPGIMVKEPTELLNLDPCNTDKLQIMIVVTATETSEPTPREMLYTMEKTAMGG